MMPSTAIALIAEVYYIAWARRLPQLQAAPRGHWRGWGPSSRGSLTSRQHPAPCRPTGMQLARLQMHLGRRTGMQLGRPPWKQSRWPNYGQPVRPRGTQLRPPAWKQLGQPSIVLNTDCRLRSETSGQRSKRSRTKATASLRHRQGLRQRPCRCLACNRVPGRRQQRAGQRLPALLA